MQPPERQCELLRRQHGKSLRKSPSAAKKRECAPVGCVNRRRERVQGRRQRKLACRGQAAALELAMQDDDWTLSV